jgi:hypothetical protein
MAFLFCFWWEQWELWVLDTKQSVSRIITTGNIGGNGGNQAAARRPAVENEHYEKLETLLLRLRRLRRFCPAHTPALVFLTLPGMNRLPRALAVGSATEVYPPPARSGIRPACPQCPVRSGRIVRGAGVRVCALTWVGENFRVRPNFFVLAEFFERGGNFRDMDP